MSNSDLGYSNGAELSNDTRREISEFVDRSDHYDSVEEFVEDAARYQIELLRRTADTAQQPIKRTDSAVLRILSLIDRTVTTVHQRVLDITHQYVSLRSRSEDEHVRSRSRTTAAEKMERYGRSDGSDISTRTYRQRTAEMRELLEREGLSTEEIEH